MSRSPDQVTEQELARRLGVPLRVVNRWLDSQRIPCRYARDGTRVIRREDADRAVAAGLPPAARQDDTAEGVDED